VQIEKQELVELISAVVKETITQLGLVNASANVKPEPQTVKEKTAYQKTEQLLYNYRAFQRIVSERREEIEDIKRYGVPKKAGAVVEYGSGGSGGTPRGIVLPEESVESRISAIERSMENVIQAIDIIDKALAAVASDPYYKAIPYRYFEGRTQEDIALELKVSQVTISKNNSRLIRELAMRLFPDQTVTELFL
jgi:RNA polymerase sigma factor (sigma-70 family)